MNKEQNSQNTTEACNDGNTVLPAVYGRKINPMDLFRLDVKSNEFIKKYRCTRLYAIIANLISE